jgi:hypothetical protein
LNFPLSFYCTAVAKASSDLNRIEVSESVLGLFNHLHRHDETIAKQPSQMGQNVPKTGRPQHKNIIFDFDGERLDRRLHMESGKRRNVAAFTRNSFGQLDSIFIGQNLRFVGYIDA